MRKYKYDGKEYDFDSYKQGAINDFDSWAQDLNLGKTQTGKIKTAMMELLQHMTDDDKSEATLTRINFGSNYANEKGLFGKNVKDSKHYRNAAAYLLKRFNNSNPYQEAKPAEKSKNKLSAEIIGQDILSRIGDISTLSDEYKKKAQTDAWNYALNKYKWDSPDDYELEGPYTLQELNQFLTEGINAFNTQDINDDNYYYSRFGIKSPFYKNPVDTQPKQLTILDQAKQQWMQNGFSEAEWNEALPSVKKMLKAGLFKQWGIDNPELVNYKLPDNTQTKPEELKTQVKSPKPKDYYKTTVVPFVTNNYNNRESGWGEINSYMVDLIQRQLKGTADEIRPQLKSINNGQYYIVEGLNTGDYLYAYDTKNKKMTFIPKGNKKAKKLPISRQKGGYLLKLNNNG